LDLGTVLAEMRLQRVHGRQGCVANDSSDFLREVATQVMRIPRGLKLPRGGGHHA
jgi:hypothetical protein